MNSHQQSNCIEIVVVAVVNASVLADFQILVKNLHLRLRTRTNDLLYSIPVPRIEKKIHCLSSSFYEVLGLSTITLQPPQAFFPRRVEESVSPLPIIHLQYIHLLSNESQTLFGSSSSSSTETASWNTTFFFKVQFCIDAQDIHTATLVLSSLAVATHGAPQHWFDGS